MLAAIGLHIGEKGVSDYYWQNSLGPELKYDVGLGWRECTKMSLRNSVSWYAVLWDDWARCCAVVDHFQWYANSHILTGRSVFHAVSMGSQLGGLLWNLMPWGSVENGVTRVEEGFGNIASNVLRLFFWQGEILWENKVPFVVGCHLPWGGCI